MIGYNFSHFLIERLLNKDDLTNLLSKMKGGMLLQDVGKLIQAKNLVHLKYDAVEVRGSEKLFKMIGAKM